MGFRYVISGFVLLDFWRDGNVNLSIHIMEVKGQGHCTIS